jgi:hypothetical protein
VLFGLVSTVVSAILRIELLLDIWECKTWIMQSILSLIYYSNLTFCCLATFQRRYHPR